MIVQELWKVTFGKGSKNKDAWVKVEEALSGADSDYNFDKSRDTISIVAAVKRRDCMTEREKKEAAFRKALVEAGWAVRTNLGNDGGWFRTLRELAEYGLEVTE